MAQESHQQTLDGVLFEDAPEPPKDEAPAEVEKPEAPPEKVEPLSRPRRADGTFKTKEEIAAEKAPKEPEAKTEEPAKEVVAEPKAAAPATKQELDPQVKAFLAAAQDERRKRQDLERQLAEIQKRLPQAEPEKKETFWDNPEGFFQKQSQALEEQRLSMKLEAAELIARSKYPDFGEMLPKFEELVRTVPGLMHQWVNSANPGEFAYQTAKNHMQLADAGSIDALRTQIEKEVRVKIEAETRAKNEDKAKEAAKLPTSLSSVKGAAASQQTQEWTGPTSLDDVLEGAPGRKKRG